jgi:hypothetical protein
MARSLLNHAGGLARQRAEGCSAAVTHSRLLQGASMSTKTTMDDQARDAWTQED